MANGKQGNAVGGVRGLEFGNVGQHNVQPCNWIHTVGVNEWWRGSTKLHLIATQFSNSHWLASYTMQCTDGPKGYLHNPRSQRACVCLCIFTSYPNAPVCLPWLPMLQNSKNISRQPSIINMHARHITVRGRHLPQRKENVYVGSSSHSAIRIILYTGVRLNASVTRSTLHHIWSQPFRCPAAGSPRGTPWQQLISWCRGNRWMQHRPANVH